MVAAFSTRPRRSRGLRCAPLRLVPGRPRTTLWALRAAPGVRSTITLPAGTELRITSVCASGLGAGRGVVRLAAEGPAPAVAGLPELRLRPEGPCGAALVADVARVWTVDLDVGPTKAEGGVDLAGYFVGRRRPSSGLRATRLPPQAAGGLQLVRLPPGWAGVSFRAAPDGRLLITEVPKACFSSAAFGARAAAQVGGVRPGDELVSVNGEAPARLAQRIAARGDVLNSCTSASPPHELGTQGKLQNPPCVSCDFVRRHREQGLDVALQLWMRAVKAESPIVLGILPQPGSAASSQVAAPSLPLEKAEQKVSAVPASCGAAAANGAVQAARPQARYNPLRPAVAVAAAAAAAAGAAAAKADQPINRAAAKASQNRASVKLELHTHPSSGFQYEERAGGQEDQLPVPSGQEVELRFSILRPNSEKVIERGEIRCRLGEGDVLDGWVDGNVDFEEVLASWSRTLVGMQPGGRRRVHVPEGKGFRTGGGQVIGAGGPFIFDAEIRRLVAPE